MAGLFVFAVHIYLTPGCILLTFDLFSQFLKIILYMFWKISAKMSLCMHESFRYCQNIYPSWLVFECGHNHPVCSSSRVQYLRTTEQEGTMGRGIQDMNNMNRWTVWALWAGRSLQLSPEHLTFPCTPLPTLCSNRVRTILALNIFATFWQELLAPLTGWNMSA